MNKGQAVTSVILWIGGIFIPAALAFGGYTVQEISSIQQRTAVVETKSTSVDDRLKRIEDKLDQLLIEKKK